MEIATFQVGEADEKMRGMIEGGRDVKGKDCVLETGNILIACGYANLGVPAIRCPARLNLPIPIPTSRSLVSYLIELVSFRIDDVVAIFVDGFIWRGVIKEDFEAGILPYDILILAVTHLWLFLPDFRPDIEIVIVVKEGKGKLIAFP